MLSIIQSEGGGRSLESSKVNVLAKGLSKAKTRLMIFFFKCLSICIFTEKGTYQLSVIPRNLCQHLCSNNTDTRSLSCIPCVQPKFYTNHKVSCQNSMVSKVCELFIGFCQGHRSFRSRYIRMHWANDLHKFSGWTYFIHLQKKKNTTQ